MNKILPIILVVVLSGCAHPTHEILGTQGSYTERSIIDGQLRTYRTKGHGFPRDQIEVITDAQVNDLRMRHVRRKMPEELCVNGFADYIELDGFIGPDSSVMVERMIKQLKPCIDKSGYKYSSTIYLNSDGGYLYDGYKMGKLFRKYGMSTRVTNNQVCASSCAAAFIGGKYREMDGNGKLLFHSPYTGVGVGFDCDNRGHVSGLKSYYNQHLKKDDSDLLLERTLSYCSSTKGWTINKGAAKLYNITKNYGAEE